MVYGSDQREIIAADSSAPSFTLPCRSKPGIYPAALWEYTLIFENVPSDRVVNGIPLQLAIVSAGVTVPSNQGSRNRESSNSEPMMTTDIRDMLRG